MIIKNIFGFTSIREFGTSLFLFTKFNWISGIFVSLSGFITNYVWDSAAPIYYLYFLFLTDFVTGIIKAIFFQKDFCSKKLPRAAIQMLVYTLMLGISFHAAKHSIMFEWFPGFLIGFFYSVQILSILENLFKMNVIPAELYWTIKKKIKAITKNEKNGNTNINV